MDPTGPNPKLIIQSLILLGSLVGFAAIFVYLRVKTGKTFHDIISQNQKLFAISIMASIVFLILIFLLLMWFNN